MQELPADRPAENFGIFGKFSKGKTIDFKCKIEKVHHENQTKISYF